MHAVAIGIDVGGTSIKGAAVDPRTGARLSSRQRVNTPVGGSPEAVAHCVAEMVAAIRAELTEAGGYEAELPIGVTLPGVVRDGVMLTAANVDAAWIGLDAAKLFSGVFGTSCTVVNDADAAGVAEAAFGAAQHLRGMTLVLTFGTGVGSACIYDGVLVPNFELGHLHLESSTNIEARVTPLVIERDGLSLQQWAGRTAGYLRHLELLFNPDRFVFGGSISKDADQFLPFDRVTVPVIPAHFRNDAGIVGAAVLAAAITAPS